jgi:hypothetical protein
VNERYLKSRRLGRTFKSGHFKGRFYGLNKFRESLDFRPDQSKSCRFKGYLGRPNAKESAHSGQVWSIWRRFSQNCHLMTAFWHHLTMRTPVRDRGEMQARYALTLIQNALIGAIRQNWRNTGGLKLAAYAPICFSLMKIVKSNMPPVCKGPDVNVQGQSNSLG